MTATLKYVKGDVTTPQFTSENEVAIIPHCCNDIGVMGAGVAVAIKQKFPGVEYFYLKSEHKLGTNSWLNPNTEKNNIIIVNMVGQKGVVSKDNSRPIKYDALYECMLDLFMDVVMGTVEEKPEYKGKKPVIHCPKFGSDLAGGKWDIIEAMIKNIWVKNGVDVVVYEWERPKPKSKPSSKIDWDADFTKNGFNWDN